MLVTYFSEESFADPYLPRVVWREMLCPSAFTGRAFYMIVCSAGKLGLCVCLWGLPQAPLSRRDC